MLNICTVPVHRVHTESNQIHPNKPVILSRLRGTQKDTR